MLFLKDLFFFLIQKGFVTQCVTRFPFTSMMRCCCCCSYIRKGCDDGNCFEQNRNLPTGSVSWLGKIRKSTGIAAMADFNNKF
ncbi:hypothetical protein HanRHA438_Chr05g0214361 [Helianthus annuus]|nr:hypothetical protein HanRHA438_Chr05g0214361 [Helianthus annuus]